MEGASAVSDRRAVVVAVSLAAALFLLDPPPVQAYIGPGAGFAFVSSFFVVFAAMLLAALKLLTWPVRGLFRLARGLRSRRALARARVRRVVILGLDGQDPEVTDSFLAEGILPNFARLREEGSYVRLRTSFPAESPVAWSCFQTGSNPGRHRVFDFLVPNRKSYLPELCSARVSASPRALRIGKLRLPLGRPSIDLGRKGESFWKVLGEHGVFSTILRVPITFPPEKFRGVMLSAMCVPDLKGSQGTFSFYSSEPEGAQPYTGGIRIPVKVEGGVVRTYVSGPGDPIVEGSPEMRLPFEVRLAGREEGADAELAIGGRAYPLRLGEFTPWIELRFRGGLGISVRGIARFYLKRIEPHFQLYMTPINVDPERPALPVSHPFTYAVYLAKTLGRFSTLGLAEDTWGLNERVLDEGAFLKLAWLVHEERERMFFDAIEKTRRGLVVCVFDITDRMQHMFWRYREDGHPANAGKDMEGHRDALRDLYRRMDDLLGRTLAALDDDTVLMVMSDHGFKSFRRGVNLNTWLWRNGFLVLKEGEPTGARWYRDVDWSRTRAFAVGIGGVYLNVRGREAKGIVEPGEQERQVKREIAEKLSELRDEDGGGDAVAAVYDTREIYRGPYVREAPDLLVGFRPGWRASWDCAVGVVTEQVFEDNTRSWSGDHCVNPPDVPGVFFCNRKLGADGIGIMDVGPTVLNLFGIEVPRHFDGKPVPVEGR